MNNNYKLLSVIFVVISLFITLLYWSAFDQYLSSFLPSDIYEKHNRLTTGDKIKSLDFPENITLPKVIFQIFNGQIFVSNLDKIKSLNCQDWMLGGKQNKCTRYDNKNPEIPGVISPDGVKFYKYYTIWKNDTEFIREFNVHQIPTPGTTTIERWDSSDLTDQDLTLPREEEIRWSPDGKYIAVIQLFFKKSTNKSTDLPKLEIFDVSNNQPKKIIKDVVCGRIIWNSKSDGFACLNWGRSGDFAYGDQTVKIYSIDGNLKKTIDMNNFFWEPTYAFALSPSEKSFVISTSNFDNEKGKITEFTFDVNGTISTTTIIANAYMTSKDNSTLPITSPATELLFTDDGKYLFSWSPQPGVFDMQTKEFYELGTDNINGGFDADTGRPKWYIGKDNLYNEEPKIYDLELIDITKDK
jgi:hypothetical protein